ncbi:lambda-exonuclease family protein [Bacillus sp. Bos-x628]|uniref:YqaJ viral recombinase family nuclease n=1 Tax=Bacillus maqinnsis TaxID=3229854 RepID=UPI003390512C
MQAKVLSSTANMSHEEWLLSRQKGIGGSDAAVVLGLSKWKTPFELWLEKTGQVLLEDEQSDAAYFGTILEEIVAKEFEIRSGKKVRKRNAILQHPDHPMIIANIDRMIVGEKAILECKTTSAYNAKEWVDDEIPASYIVQVQYYLGILGPEYKKGYFAVLIGGNQFVWKEVERDEELIEMIFSSVVNFWNDHVLSGVAPPLDGSSAAEEFLKKKYAQSDSTKVVDLTSANKERIQHYLRLKAEIAALQTQAKELENQIKQEMKDAETGFVGKYQATWKPVVSKRVDTNKLKEHFPDVYQKVIKETHSRRFGIKEVK